MWLDNMLWFYIRLDIYSLLLEVSVQYKISALISALIIAILLQKKMIIPFLFQSYYFTWLFQSIPDDKFHQSCPTLLLSHWEHINLNVIGQRHKNAYIDAIWYDIESQPRNNRYAATMRRQFQDTPVPIEVSRGTTNH